MKTLKWADNRKCVFYSFHIQEYKIQKYNFNLLIINHIDVFGKWIVSSV